MKNISAYILCGGKSSRFGSDKALAMIKGKTLIEIVARELKKIFSEIVLVAEEPGKYSFTGFECITDVYPNRGPLGGIHAALKHASTEKVFIISCDMPLITGEIIGFIAGYKTDKEVVLPKAGAKNHYMCGIYGKKLLPAAEELLKNTKNLSKSASPYDLISKLGIELIDFNTLPGFDIKYFFNLNSPEELKLIEKI
jgi:molybdopterin-guanine dinucleotide biosynthesis protein A